MTNHASVAQRGDALADSEAYRSYLISRNQTPIVYHAPRMQLKRLQVLARRFVGCLASHRVAVAAGKVRRLQRTPVLRGDRDHRPHLLTVNRGRA